MAKVQKSVSVSEHFSSIWLARGCFMSDMLCLKLMLSTRCVLEVCFSLEVLFAVGVVETLVGLSTVYEKSVVFS